MAKGSTGYDPGKLGKTLGGQLQGYATGPTPPPSVGTTQGIAGLLSAANNPQYDAAIKGAIGTLGDTAAGNNLGVEAPGYRAVRDNLRSTITGDVNASMGANGRYGSNVHTGTLTDSLASSLGALDMAQYNSGLDRQVQAASVLPGLQTASTQPALTSLTAGQAQDNTNNAGLDRLLKILGAFNGSQGSAGMTQETPLWQSALGLAGMFL